MAEVRKGRIKFDSADGALLHRLFISKDIDILIMLYAPEPMPRYLQTCWFHIYNLYSHQPHGKLRHDESMLRGNCNACRTHQILRRLVENHFLITNRTVLAAFHPLIDAAKVEMMSTLGAYFRILLCVAIKASRAHIFIFPQ